MHGSGVLLYPPLSQEVQVTSAALSTYYQLCKCWHTNYSTTILGQGWSCYIGPHTLLSSWLGYCSALLAGIQWFRSCSWCKMHLLGCLHPITHITLGVQNLHCLITNYQANFKVLPLPFKALECLLQYRYSWTFKIFHGDPAGHSANSRLSLSPW